MSVTLEDLEELQMGLRGPVHVGELPYEVWTALGLVQPNVYLDREELIHSLKHLDKFDMLRLPMCIHDGLLIQEVGKPCIMAAYQDPYSHRRFIAALKVANEKSEIWISSFYRGKARQTRKLLRRGVILKNHS
jgi:hypothetical protein